MSTTNNPGWISHDGRAREGHYLNYLDPGHQSFVVKIGAKGSKLHRTSSAIWVPCDPKGEKKVGKRSDRENLLDYLVHINQKSHEDAPGEMIFEEGFGAKDGCDRNYWTTRLQQEKRRIHELKQTPSECDVKVLRTPDNTVFSHVNQRVREFFELGGYRAFPEVVTVSIDVREVLKVDTKDGLFRVSFIATTRWYDAIFDNHDYTDATEFQTTTRPYITFDHVDEGDDPQGVPPDAAALSQAEKHSGTVYRKPMDPPGVLYHSQRIQATFRAENQLRKFPFDVQTLSMNVRLWGSSIDSDNDCGRILLPLTVEMKLAHRHLEWTAYQASAFLNGKRRLDRQDLQIDLKLKRRAAFFENNVYVILFSMPTMSFFSFAVPGDGTGEDDGFIGGFESRCQITLTLMLTSVAYKFYLEGMLPKAPYLTLLDKYIYFCFWVICAIFLANTLTLVTEYYQNGPDNFAPIGSSQPNKDEHESSAAVHIDNIFCYSLFAIWITGNCWVIWFARKASMQMRKLAVGRVASDQEVAAMIEKRRTNTKFNPREQRVDKDIQERKKKRGEYQKNFVRYVDDQNTIRKRQQVKLKYWKALEAKELKNGNDIGPKKNQGDSAVCKDRLKPMVADQDILILCLKAGIQEWRAGALTKQFQSQELTPALLEVIFSSNGGTVAVQNLLEQIGVALADQVKIIAALAGNKFSPPKDPVRVLALQGSSSYLVIALDLAGKLTPMADFKRRLVEEIELIKAGTPSPKMSIVTNAANLIFAHTVFQSSLTSAEYMYSQRKFAYKGEPNSKYVVASQVWTGYLVARRKEWKGDAAIGVDIGTGKMAFGYANVRSDSTDEELPAIKSIDLSKQEDKKAPGKFLAELQRAVKFMDTREELSALIDIDIDETDTDRLGKMCEPLLTSLVGILEHLEKEGANITGKEPIFFFGTMKMRNWLTEFEAKHGARCFELLQATATYMELRMPQKRAGSKHKIYFDICPQEEEAKSEHLAFKLALKWGQIEDEANQAILEAALKANQVGNLAWGNGSMQGFPDCKTYVNAELGLSAVEDLFKEQIEIHGSTNKDGRDLKFKFKSKEAAKIAVTNCMTKVQRRLRELAPRLPMSPGKVAERTQKLAGGGSPEDLEDFGLLDGFNV